MMVGWDFKTVFLLIIFPIYIIFPIILGIIIPNYKNNWNFEIISWF